MKLFLYLSDFIVPLMIFGIICYGITMKIPVYDTFVKGAKDGFLTVIKIMPTMVGLMVAVGVLRASGFLEFLAQMIGKVTQYIGFPGELVPLTIVKMFSSSAATGLLLDVYKEYGTDSYLGLVASISMSCTETIFYTMSVYFDRKSNKNKIHTARGITGNTRRIGGQRSTRGRSKIEKLR